LMGLWSAGGGMIIWLAGLKGISPSYYEAAALDGANAWQRFRTITLPLLTPYILFNFIIGLIATLQIFTQSFIMTQGGPIDSTLFYAYHLFNNAFRFLQMGYASALGWFLFLAVFALTLLQLKLSARWVHYEE
jgi:multiple sugar transport system permease protein